MKNYHRIMHIILCLEICTFMSSSYVCVSVCVYVCKCVCVSCSERRSGSHVYRRALGVLGQARQMEGAREKHSQPILDHT